eukprot:gnl/MRDRNA2_/MRDRNA2_109337_c0_seq1.p1 gnl/MRDRNA2_/MRDRNA2_109337_c0~~gnl/MRDRNA2_/MRDRNA2_109337_c0_seq1.p1  ORF type:complete len:788 (+),score=140.33 gnl/MRDRNA2_/MRDRNA2_109337_c0_seq1:89-2452(+)
MPSFPHQKHAAFPLPAVAQASAPYPRRGPMTSHEEVEKMYRDRMERAKRCQVTVESAGKPGSKENGAQPSIMVSEDPSCSNVAQPSIMGNEAPLCSNVTTLGALPLPAAAHPHQDPGNHAIGTHDQLESVVSSHSMERETLSPNSSEIGGKPGSEEKTAQPSPTAGEEYDRHHIFDKMRKSTVNLDDAYVHRNDGLPRAVQLLVHGAIIFSSVQLGLQIDYPENYEFYYWMEIICNGIFVLEMILKLNYSRANYFKSGWNLFDFSLVMIAVVDFTANQLGGGSSVNLSGLRAIRMLRAARVIRMLKVFKELWLIVRGIAMSLRALTWVILLLVMILYMSGILCTIVMEDAGPMYPGFTQIDEIPGGENMEYFNPNEMFGSIPRSMYTLFQLALLTEFSQFGRPIFEKQPEFFPFFLLFIFIVTFGVLNVLVAVIVEVTMEASENLKQEEGDRKMRHKLALLDQLQHFVFKMDEGHTGSISMQQFAAACEDEEMQKLLVNMGFPVGFTAEELWTLLDHDGNGILEVEEFVRMALRLVTCSQEAFQFQCVLMSNLSRLQQSVNTVKEEIKSNTQHGTTCKQTVIPWTTTVVSRCKSRRQRLRCYTKVHRKLRSRNCRVVHDGVSKSETNLSGTVSAEQLDQSHLNRLHGVVEHEMSPEEIKSLLHDSVPEVDTKPSEVVCTEQLDKLLANRVHGMLPSEMSPAEINSLLEWRKYDTGQLKYKELQESVACLAACLDNAEVFKCFMLSSVRETQRQAAATHDVCNALLENRGMSNSGKSANANQMRNPKL